MIGWANQLGIYFIDAKKDKEMRKILQSSRYSKAVVGWEVFPLLGNLFSCGKYSLLWKIFPPLSSTVDRILQLVKRFGNACVASDT